MQGPVDILQIIINGAILWGLILALGTLFRKSLEKNVARTFAAFATAQSLALFPITLSNYNVTFTNPVANSLLSLSPLFIGPLYYLYFRTAFHIEPADIRANLKHFIFLPAYFTAILILYAKMEFLFHREPFDLVMFYNYKRWFIAVQFLHMIFYYVLTIVVLTSSLKDRKNPGEITSIKLGILFTALYLCAISVAPISMAASGLRFPRAAIMSSFVIMMTIIATHYILSQRYPLHMAFGGSMVRKAPEPDEEEWVFFGEIEERVDALMNADRIYRSEDFTLAMMAVELKIQPWQLSRFFNSFLNQNFRAFINSYRIREARHLLIHEPEKKVLTIAFDVGFNSKASFNRVFQKTTGLSPSDYRKLHQQMEE